MLQTGNRVRQATRKRQSAPSEEGWFCQQQESKGRILVIMANVQREGQRAGGRARSVKHGMRPGGDQGSMARYDERERKRDRERGVVLGYGYALRYREAN